MCCAKRVATCKSAVVSPNAKSPRGAGLAVLQRPQAQSEQAPAAAADAITSASSHELA